MPPTTSAVAASFGQQRLWFLDRLEPGGAVYHIPLAVRLRGALDRKAASGALIGIVARHEVLRTTFAVEDDQVVQVIHSGLFPAWREEALADETELPGALTAEARRPFDLAAGPLLRSVLWRLGPEDHVLQLTLHHIVSDGWSLGVLVEEFAAEYRSRCAGGDGAARPELALQYADYAAWQRDLLRDEALERGTRILAEAPGRRASGVIVPSPIGQGRLRSRRWEPHTGSRSTRS